MNQTDFGGGNKQNTSFLRGPERAFVAAITPHVPRFLSTRVLTMLSCVWSAGIIWFCYAAQGAILWLWGANAMIVLHWLTDLLDGSVGRYRNEGYVRWGFYMDHVLDFALACSVFLGYAFLVDQSALFSLLIFFVVFAFVPATLFLSFSAYNALKIGALGFGPTEYRLAIIILNIAIIYYGAAWLGAALPYFSAVLGVYVLILIFRTQRDMARMDMRDRK